MQLVEMIKVISSIFQVMTVVYDDEHSDLLAVYMIQSLYGLHSFFLAVKLIIIFELEIKGLFANKSLTLRK